VPVALLPVLAPMTRETGRQPGTGLGRQQVLALKAAAATLVRSRSTGYLYSGVATSPARAQCACMQMQQQQGAGTATPEPQSEPIDHSTTRADATPDTLTVSQGWAARLQAAAAMALAS
jgi:hypothetical protein